MAKTAFDGNRISSSIMSSPTKSPLKPKKAPVITRGTYSKVRVGSYGTKDLLLIGAAGKDREGKKDRRVCTEMSVPCNSRWAVTVQRIGQKYIKSTLWTVTVPVSVQPC